MFNRYQLQEIIDTEHVSRATREAAAAVLRALPPDGVDLEADDFVTAEWAASHAMVPGVTYRWEGERGLRGGWAKVGGLP